MFITVEGPDGSGKSTLARTLHSYLKAGQGSADVLLTREPGGSGEHIGESIRSLVLNSSDLLVSTQTLLMFASRLEHCHKFVIPALLAGNTVICDRFTASTYVYQFFESCMSMRVYEELIKILEELFRSRGLKTSPDLQLILDVDYETAIRRIESRTGTATNHFDIFDAATFDRKRRAYLKYASMAGGSVVIINASGDGAETFSNCIKYIHTLQETYENKCK